VIAPCDLGDRGVLVTRPAGQAARLCRLIEEAGGRAIPFPAIEILPAADPAPARRLLAQPWDLLIFVSRNAVNRAFDLLPGRHLPGGTVLAAVGAATAAALAEAGREPDLMPNGRYDSEALLALPRLADMRGKRVLIVRGEGGRALLGETLSARGAEVAYAEVYRRGLPEADTSELVAHWSREVQLVTATSGEILVNLLTLVGEAGREPLLATPLVVVSERTAETAKSLRFSRVEVAQRADDEAVLAALCRANRGQGHLAVTENARSEVSAPGGTAWSHFVHGADIGVEGRGATLAAAFEQAALALTGVVTDPSVIEPTDPVEVFCEAPDPELLLVDWLNALVYEMATRRMLFGRFRVSIEGDRLTGTAWGESVQVDRHHPAVEVKGATYTQLSVGRVEDGSWTARCVVDV
jgi:uroporphyrinogen-III synthase